jgi:predicted negative regulator of RcsB-dependent stress response
MPVPPGQDSLPPRPWTRREPLSACAASVWLPAAPVLRPASTAGRFPDGQLYVNLRGFNGLGDALAAWGQPASARVEYERGLALASEVTERRQQARAHDGLGRAYLASGDTGRAREHWEQALAHYAETPGAARPR